MFWKIRRGWCWICEGSGNRLIWRAIDGPGVVAMSYSFPKALVLCVAAGFAALPGTVEAADPRTALVIGNSAYASAALANPGNDANDIASALRQAGFDVMLKLDADQGGMQEAIRAFGQNLKSKGGVGLFYFAGHGAQFEGENYLLPVGGAIVDAAGLKASAVSASDAVDAMAKAGNGLNIVILDACRDNPFAGKTGEKTRGLSRIDSSARLFVSYSTSPGAVALDGSGRNSPYTKHLVQAIGTPDLSIEDTFKRTLKGVYQETKGDQTPWLSSSFFGDFVFQPKRSVSATLPSVVEKISGDRALQRMATLGGIYRGSGKNPDGSDYYGIAALVPRGNQVDFTWWITKDVFSGKGELAGKMLVVKWGDKHPAVYTFDKNGLVEGEWADGSATDRLELFAPLAVKAAPNPQGAYRTDGMNPDGKPYAGTVKIARRQDRYQFNWETGPTSYSGTGTRQGNLLIVDWGGSMPMVYVLDIDGKLHGLWEAGFGHETLTPDR